MAMPHNRGRRDPDVATICRMSRNVSTVESLSPARFGPLWLTRMPMKLRMLHHATLRPYLGAPGTKYGHPILTSSAGTMLTSRMIPCASP